MDRIQIRECTTIDEFDSCIRLQREVFGLPELEISPRRHLIVSRQAGGWTLGAFVADGLVGFVHHLAAVHKDIVFGYSHMMAVARAYQSKGVGARLKWSQRERAMNEGRNFIKWTWDPLQARNAYFNLNRLGVTVRSYAANFYGTDYSIPEGTPPPGIDSDRLFAEWRLNLAKVIKLAQGAEPTIDDAPARAIQIPADWNSLYMQDARAAKAEQLRVRAEFQNAFRSGLECRGFDRTVEPPRYLLYERRESDGLLGN